MSKVQVKAGLTVRRSSGGGRSSGSSGGSAVTEDSSSSVPGPGPPSRVLKNRAICVI